MAFCMRFVGTAVALLALTVLPGCTATQPVVEVTATTIVTPLPFSLTQLEARRLCREHTEATHGQPPEPESVDVLDREVERYQALVEESLIYRADTVRLVERVRVTLEKGEAISGHDLSALNDGFSRHLALRAELFRVAVMHECWLDDDPLLTRLTSAQRLKGVMISLSAALVLYDNYLLAISLYQEEPRLRRLLNNQDVGYGIDYGDLDRIALSFASETNRNRVRRGVVYYEERIGAQTDRLASDRHLLFLNQLITQSPSYSMTKRYSPLAALGRKLDFYTPFTAEALVRLKSEGVGMASMLFGNTVGLVESRRGTLYGRDDVALELKQELEAGDVLVERTPFRLTNTFIPGYFGHAAIWLGTEHELRAIGIWNHPVVAPYHEAIREGRSVVEALRSGVELNSIGHFLNVDDLVVMRKQDLDDEVKAEVIVEALRHMGKRYDFNFDVETRDTVGCAELVYHAYGRVDWKTQKHLGLKTVTPDNIAAKALGDSPFALVRLYISGERITDNPRQVLADVMAQGRATPPTAD